MYENETGVGFVCMPQVRAADDAPAWLTGINPQSTNQKKVLMHKSEKVISHGMSLCFYFIVLLQVREDAPQWLQDETRRVREGLMALRQNVVLLQDEEDPDRFYPRWVLVVRY